MYSHVYMSACNEYMCVYVSTHMQCACARVCICVRLRVRACVRETVGTRACTCLRGRAISMLPEDNTISSFLRPLQSICTSLIFLFSLIVVH
jgi:hypothetical protein